jgi:hypothetical protein
MVLKKKNRVEVRKKKFALWNKLWDCLDKYKKILVVKCDNISASIFQDVRQAIRPLGATLIMGKNVRIQRKFCRLFLRLELRERWSNQSKVMKISKSERTISQCQN